ncbi:MAG: class I SAM-dependent methyltransferase [Oscillospiraceae bacterium]|nr:class I SAM-dependent methyltransferase [Oscillospiraceae bacterium]
MGQRYYQNACKPKGLSGRRFLKAMNRHHAELADWGLTYVELAPDAEGLDAGCGGGGGVARLLELCPKGNICGLDYSDASVRFSRRRNAAAIEAGRCEIVQADIRAIPWKDDHFDFVTAFESIYYWPGPAASFREVYRVLRPGGWFLICNEDTDPENDPWVDIIDGMTIYPAETLQSLLREAGFRKVQCYPNPTRGWLSVVAYK